MDYDDLLARISIDPQVCGGKPCFKGAMKAKKSWSLGESMNAMAAPIRTLQVSVRFFRVFLPSFV
jgi:hypothetical protein